MRFFPPQVVELGDWVPWEFQHENDEAPLPFDDSDEVVPSPPAGMTSRAASLSHVKGGGLAGELGGEKAPEAAGGDQKVRSARRFGLGGLALGDAANQILELAVDLGVLDFAHAQGVRILNHPHGRS